MQARFSALALLFVSFAGSLYCFVGAQAQDAPANNPPQQAARAPTAAEDLPSSPKGVEVLTRGPVHEAFATPTSEPVPTKPVSKQPPKALDEMPPEQKPEGSVIWIGGYWGWDDDRNDFLWVSGVWRSPPPNKRWVAGYWKQDAEKWTWVPGFWAAAEQQQTETQQLTYHPAPPAPPEIAAPGASPTPDSFYVPGSWVWHDAGYATIGGGPVWREAGYSWTAGYWAHVQPGYVWVSAHYRWTPYGYIWVRGYWDLAVADRGVLYAPVIVDPVVVGPAYVYTPALVVASALLIDALFVRPCYCHYYFGDYYGPVYRGWGFESCVIYSRRHYDPIFVYARWEHRADPRWETVHIDITLARHAGQAPLPPRTLAQQNAMIQHNTTIINNNTTIVNNNYKQSFTPVVMPASRLAATTGTRMVPVSTAARVEARQQAQAIQQVATQRSQAELSLPRGAPSQPRATALKMPANMPPAQPFAQRAGSASASVHTSTAGGAGNAAHANSGGYSPPSHPGQPAIGPAAHGPVAPPNGARPMPIQRPGMPLGPRPLQKPPSRPNHNEPPPKHPPG